MLATQEIMDQERRIAPRRRVLMSAQVVYNNGYNSVECTVRNISETGAQLAIEGRPEIPSSFFLRFQDGSKRAAEIAWRKSNLLGIRFIEILPSERRPEPQPASSNKAALIARIVEIEKQLAALRAEILGSMQD